MYVYDGDASLRCSECVAGKIDEDKSSGWSAWSGSLRLPDDVDYRSSSRWPRRLPRPESSLKGRWICAGGVAVAWCVRLVRCWYGGERRKDYVGTYSYAIGAWEWLTDDYPSHPLMIVRTHGQLLTSGLRLRRRPLRK